ncbi:uncharacterized protein LOC105431284 [Pogonomyrmex barbatus]|uniref:Uncharacterized protein LOC105431284 n=1 Tax=Pogonomyrmex barbatus TaxID=144034 RepID=A0A6I9XER9_9HYME|nr:uncharacterized protein LOC105431284 [Pogonomyrmex barbatus]
MEDEDFGFAKRTDNVLRKALTVGNERTHKNTIHNDEQRICSPSKVGFLLACGPGFQVKYLGSHDARGLWGIKHTRRPVDNMVSAAKALPTNTMLSLIKLVVSQEGVALLPLDKRKQDANLSRMYPIETISYGVQDLVYTRVFSMIVVRETENFRRISPFECHGFVCESKYYARQLTYALAAAFEVYSKTVKAQEKLTGVTRNTARKKFAIDLRSPEEIEADLTMDSEA